MYLADLVSASPKGPCTQIVDTLVLVYFLYRYFGAKVYTFGVHGPLGLFEGSGKGGIVLVASVLMLALML